MTRIARLPTGSKASEIWFQLLMSCLVVIASVMIFSLAGVVAAAAFTGLPLSQVIASDYAHVSYAAINGLKIIQLFSVLGMFVVPGLVLPWLLFRADPLRFTGITTYAPFVLFLLAFVIYYTFVPLMELTIEWNMALKLPAALKGLEEAIRQMEDNTNVVIRRFLEMHSAGDYIADFLIIAALPAFAEELFFRGFVQKLFLRWWGKKHMAVILGAFIFSFFHLQFYGFLPRLLLGMLLGYLFLWSGDLKVSMLVHFLNNFTSLLQAWLMGTSVNESMPFPNYTYLLSALAGAFFLYYYYQRAVGDSKPRWVSPDGSIVQGPDSIKQSWVTIYASNSPQQAEVVAGRLRSEGIEAVVINKRDSSYPIIGEVSVNVRTEDADRARSLINGTMEN